jgi:molybdopterin-synthase adenylyltransferase
MLQMLALALDPLGQSNPGEQLYHFVGGYMEPPTFGTCHPVCLFRGLVARGDHCGFVVTGRRPPQLRAETQVAPAPESIIRRALATVSGVFTSIASAIRRRRA